jgi:tRNA-intron endonuclease
MQNISTILTKNGVIVPVRNEAISLHREGYGLFSSDNNLFSLRDYETMYLVERGKISVIEEETHNKLVFQELLWKFSIGDPLFWTKYIIYRDIRYRGFIALEGPGIGVDLYVYERGTYGKKTPRYLVYTIWEGEKESLKNLNKILIKAKIEDKILVLAVIDRRGEIIYYLLSEENFTNL